MVTWRRPGTDTLCEETVDKKVPQSGDVVFARCRSSLAEETVGGGGGWVEGDVAHDMSPDIEESCSF